ncbi:HNH endonuclease [Bacillus thuringiensis]|uniref:HNH endonuclease n=1 Tax=Bacillus thuringiensis TaxID=1428 RepID=UPI0035DA0C32
MDSVTPFVKGVEILPDGSVARSGTNYSGKFQESHDASKASIQSRISNLESGGVKGTGNSSKIVNEANLNNIDEFINGTKKFDDVINDYVKLYSEKIISNKTWSWNKSLHGGANLTARQKRMIKEKAVADGLVPDVKVIKADGMRYGFADFKSAGLVVETKQLPERLWLMSDEEQFKWLDNAIGGRPEGMT